MNSLTDLGISAVFAPRFRPVFQKISDSTHGKYFFRLTLQKEQFTHKAMLN